MIEHNSCRRQRGFTLTELAIVLGIISTILGVIWVTVSHVYTNMKAQKAAKEILTIVNGTRGLFPQHRTTNVAISPLLINNGTIHADMLASCASAPYPTFGGVAGCAFLPWSGVQIIVGSQYAWNGAPVGSSLFEVRTSSLTTSQCASFLPAFVQEATIDGLVWVYTDATAGLAVNLTTPITTFAGCSGVMVLQFKL